jgi:hypothetical protein
MFLLSSRRERDKMSATRDWFVRVITRSNIDTSTVEWVAGRKSPNAIPAALNVDNANGARLSLVFDRKFVLDAETAKSEKASDLQAALQAWWPKTAGKRTLRQFGDGLQLCDIAAALRSDVHAVGLLEYGALNKWWRLVYDENITCTHASASCPQYCTVYVDDYKSRSGRRKKKKQKVTVPLRSKFRLSDLLPERGVAIA